MTSKTDKSVHSYKVFIQDVVEEYLFATANYKTTAEELQSGSDELFKLFNIYKHAVNISRKINNNNQEHKLVEVFEMSSENLQNITNKSVINATEGNITALSFWSIYLEEIFSDHPELNLDLSKDTLLTTHGDIKYLEYILGHVFAKQRPEVVELYIWWILLRDMILYTTHDMRVKHKKYLRSIEMDASYPPKVVHCTQVLDQWMGMALSFGIAKPEFLKETKASIQTMWGFVQEGFFQLVKELNWMDSQTKRDTVEKAKRMVSLIGFPEWILNKTALDLYYHEVS